jgi:tRNA (cmo5U34)-methyltransferase
VTRSSFEDGSIAIMNYTLQFIPMEERARLLQRVYNGMRPGEYRLHTCFWWLPSPPTFHGIPSSYMPNMPMCIPQTLGGILFISEKVRSGYGELHKATTSIYEDFKARAGYSLDEIAR